jgi:hypothetical protein
LTTFTYIRNTFNILFQKGIICSSLLIILLIVTVYIYIYMKIS